MARVFRNFLGGETDVALASGDTTLSSPALAALDTIASPDVLAVVLDPDGIGGAPEIVEITAHTTGATTATITRAAESTTARAHAAGVEWVGAVTSADLDGFATAGGGGGTTYGPDLLPGQTITASASSGGFPASNLNDGNPATVWKSGTTSHPQTLTVDFGAGNEKAVRRAELEHDGTAGTGIPTQWSLLFSDNGTDWYGAGSFWAAQIWRSELSKSLDVDDKGAHRYWRVSIGLVCNSTLSSVDWAAANRLSMFEAA